MLKLNAYFYYVEIHLLLSFTAQNSVEIYILETISSSDREDKHSVLLEMDIKRFDAVCSGSQISHNLIYTNKLWNATALHLTAQTKDQQVSPVQPSVLKISFLRANRDQDQVRHCVNATLCMWSRSGP